MKLVSLNIRHGGGARVPQLLAWLKAQYADFILLTEWRPNTAGLRLKNELEEIGYGCEGESDGPTANGLLIASKRPFETIDLTPQASPNGEVLAVDLENGIRVLCCYFPQLDAKKPFFEVCLKQAANVNKPLLIVGDLNTGNNNRDLEAGATIFSCSDQFDELTNKGGMVDLWRLTNGGDAREWTWHSPKKGFRIDHALGNQAFVSSVSTIRCWYDKSTRDNGFTDHSGMIVAVT